MTESIISKNPSTLEVIGTDVSFSPDQVRQAFEKAKSAFEIWSTFSYKERGAYMLRAREYILDHLDELIDVISLNNGKAKVDSLSADLLPICDLLQYFAKKSEKILKAEKINIGLLGWLGRKSKIVYEPLGVVGVISPWNFPFAIPMSGVVMALMAGNTVLLKPADATAKVGFAIEKIFKSIGLPEGVFTHLPGAVATGEALLELPLDRVIFTGSVRVGKRVMEKCAQQLIPCTLELGGKDPMIVCQDAHLEQAAQAAVWGAFFNSGQVCASVERVYVDERIASAFIEKVVAETSQLKQGNPMEGTVDIGSLTTENQLKIVESQVEEAKQRGAKILTGGERNKELPGYFYPPTVLTGVDHSFRCVAEETFGPTLPIMTFKTEEEAVKLANDSVYGLTASVWTRDLKRGEKLARQIRSGTVMVNECAYSYAIPQTPWGGLKQSGFGRTHGAIGLHELVHIKHIHENRLPGLPDFWWYPYDQKLYLTYKKLARNLTGTSVQKIKAIFQVLGETIRFKRRGKQRK